MTKLLAWKEKEEATSTTYVKKQQKYHPQSEGKMMI